MVKSLGFKIEKVEVKANNDRVLHEKWTMRTPLYQEEGKRIKGQRYRGTYRYGLSKMHVHHGLEVEEELTKFLAGFLKDLMHG